MSVWALWQPFVVTLAALHGVSWVVGWLAQPRRKVRRVVVEALHVPGAVFLWYAALLHLLWAGLLWIDQGLVRTTPVFLLYVVCGSQWWVLSLVLLAASVLTLVMLMLPHDDWWSLGLLQQSLVLLSGDAAC
jgi:hypothetical protein